MGKISIEYRDTGFFPEVHFSEKVDICPVPGTDQNKIRLIDVISRFHAQFICQNFVPRSSFCPVHARYTRYKILRPMFGEVGGKYLNKCHKRGRIPFLNIGSPEETPLLLGLLLEVLT